MKKIILFLAVIGLVGLQGCTGPRGPQGNDGQDGLLAQVYELQNVNFAYDATNGYNIYGTFSPNLYLDDSVVMYRLSGTINSSTPIWQQIPRTLYFLPSTNELDYDFDFSKVDFTIYAGGNYDLSTTPTYINSQTFRIVVIPGAFANKNKSVDLSDYNAVIKAYNIDDSHVKVLNK